MRNDKLIWAASKDGRYNVKNGYKAIIQSQRWEEEYTPLKLCWDSSCLPKTGFFLWTASQDRILTTDRLRKLGIEGPSRCVLCNNDNEDNNHLLYKCSYTQKCWEWLRNMLRWTALMLETLNELLKGWPTNNSGGIYGNIQNICPSILVWEIWKARNRRIFNNQEIMACEITNKIEACIV